MTANQINYAKLREDQRHNIVDEGIRAQANIINERNAAVNERNAATNAFNANINLLNARTKQAEVAEYGRHNVRDEGLTAERNAEILSHDTTMEVIEADKSVKQSSYWGDLVSARLAEIKETNRHNVAAEALQAASTRANFIGTLVQAGSKLIDSKVVGGFFKSSILGDMLSGG